MIKCELEKIIGVGVVELATEEGFAHVKTERLSHFNAVKQMLNSIQVSGPLSQNIPVDATSMPDNNLRLRWFLAYF